MEELYTLEREVGRGSYGVVFEGRMAKTGERLAIKRLPCSNPECIELYLQELWAMRVTAKNHPNVIALHSCLLQTGPRTLQTLRPGKLPLGLVESALKGNVVGVPQTDEDGNSQSAAQQQQQRARSAASRPKLQDRTNTGPARSAVTTTYDAKTPQRPPQRPKKRPAQTGEEQQPRQQQQRCLALWLLMEYCDGGDLNQYLLSRPLDIEQNHSIVQQLSRAMAFLHGLGISHRDLKPDNVLVCVSPTGPVVKVADFGLSKMSEGLLEGTQPRQHFSSTCGSDFYMAPEVWGGLSYTGQADIFSLGVMFWAILERITFKEEGTTQEQLGAYACKARTSWLIPLGEAMWENPGLQLNIPVKFKRAPPLPPPPSQAMCSLLLDMLAYDPDARPFADQLEARVHSAIKEDPR